MTFGPLSHDCAVSQKTDTGRQLRNANARRDLSIQPVGNVDQRAAQPPQARQRAGSPCAVERWRSERIMQPRTNAVMGLTALSIIELRLY